MSSLRFPSARLVSAGVLGAALLPALAGCGPRTGEFAPACPHAALAPETGDLTRFQPGGSDLTDLVLQARIVAVSGKCKAGDEPNQVDAAVIVGVELVRGPAMQGRVAELPVFVAVTEGDRVLDKFVQPMQMTFPPNVDRGTSDTQEFDMTLPVSRRKSSAAYTIWVGFQLTPQELEDNRRRNQRSN